jgi:hypothetical protein
MIKTFKYELQKFFFDNSSLLFFFYFSQPIGLKRKVFAFDKCLAKQVLREINVKVF